MRFNPLNPNLCPDIAAHLEPAPRRPGELHEAVVVPEWLAARASTVAGELGLSTSVAVTLLVEAHIARGDLVRAGSQGVPAVGEGTVRRRLSAAEADYLRSLTAGRKEGSRPEETRAILIPVRLLAWATEDALVEALEGDAHEALSWEVEALLAGGTLREWVLLRALAS